MVRVVGECILRVTSPDRTRLAVLGSPVGHSRSPVLHAAAYGVLGLPWTYGAVELVESELPGFLDGLGDGWRGLSLTMPLKRVVLRHLAVRSGLVDAIGAANTVLVTDDGLVGFNTDVYGVVRALESAGVPRIEDVHLIGAGATAASVVAAVIDRGALHVTISARSPERAAPVAELARGLGATAEVLPLDASPETSPGLVVSTLPGGSAVDVLIAGVPAGAVLFDVAYDPWPSRLAERWNDAGQQVVSGIEMLVYQALAQVRVFAGGDPTTGLDDEPAVLTAMRASVGLPG